MNKRSSNDPLFERWRPRVRSKAKKLVNLLGDLRLPIPLRSLANLCNAEVVFESLPVAGMTRLEQGKFHIHCNCALKDVKKWTTKFGDERDQGRWLPARTRFTIAHEIAHTFFYERDGNTFRNQFKPMKDSELKCLESLCDLGASYLLLPHLMLEQRLNRNSVLDPRFLWSLSKEFRVSKEALIIRLNKDSGLWRPIVPGGAFIIRGWPREAIIDSCVTNEATERFFGKLRIGDDLRKLGFNAPRLVVFGGWELQDTCPIPGDRRNGLCDLRVHLVKGTSCLLTIAARL